MKPIHREESLTGFTLVETLAAISIILILTAVLLPNYNQVRKRFGLLRSAYILSQNLRKAQEMATSTREFLGKVPAGYGIYLQEGGGNYLLYADTSPAEGNKQYDPDDGVLESIDFESQVFIKSVLPTPLSINFKGPSPETTFSGGVSSVTIILGLTSMPNEEQRIFINQVGLIYVE